MNHTLSHIPGPPKRTLHISNPAPIFTRPSRKNPDKSPLYKFSLNCSRGFCPGVLSGVVFIYSPVILSECICYNKKVNITLYFMFHMYDLKKFISVTSHAFDPLSQTVTPSRTPPPSRVT